MNRQGQLQVLGWPMEPTETEIPGCLGAAGGNTLETCEIRWSAPDISRCFQWNNSDHRIPNISNISNIFKYFKFELCFYCQDSFLGFPAAARWLCWPVFDTAAWKATCKFSDLTHLTKICSHTELSGDSKPARLWALANDIWYQMMQVWLEPYVHCMLLINQDQGRDATTLHVLRGWLDIPKIPPADWQSNELDWGLFDVFSTWMTVSSFLKLLKHISSSTATLLI